MNKYVKNDITSKPKLSLVDHLVCIGRVDQVGIATWFISHAWSYQFLDVVESIQLFMNKEYNEKANDVYIWFDIFSVCQHFDAVGDRPFSWWTSTFKEAIRSMGNVLMIMLPWDNPYTLTRAWCIFEIYSCDVTGSRFEVSMTSAERARFFNQMMNEVGSYHNMLSLIHI